MKSDCKTTRDQFKVELRKQKNEDAFALKRTYSSKGFVEESLSFYDNSKPREPSAKEEEIIALYKDFLQEVNSPNRNFEKIGKHFSSLRKKIANAKEMPLETIFNLKLYEGALLFLEPSYSTFPDLQIESLLLMTHLTAAKSEYTQKLTQLGLIPLVMRFLSSNSDEALELSLWVLCNLIGEKETRNREIILQEGAILLLVERLKGMATKPASNLLRSIAWFVASITRPPCLSFDLCTDLIRILDVTMSCPDYEVKLESAWACNHIFTSIRKEQSRLIFQSPVVKSLTKKCIEFTCLSEKNIVMPSLRAISQLVSIFEDSEVQELLGYGLVNALMFALDSKERIIRKEAAFTLANLTCGLPSQIEELTIHPAFFPRVRELLATDHIDIKDECVNILLSISSWKFYPLIQSLVNNCAIELLLDTADKYQEYHQLVLNCLNCLYNILVSEKTLPTGNNGVFRERCENNGIDVIFLRLQKHPNPDIYDLVIKITEDFFDVVIT